jgi:carboxypeptidase C (cathepsin A)
MICRLATLAALLLGATPIIAQTEDEPSKNPTRQWISIETTHSIPIGGRELSYTSIAETIHLLDQADEPEAEFFSFTYIAQTESAEAHRPVVFAFNGGPGSASVWLHMGVLGPKRVRVPSDARAAGAPPYPLVENPHTLLAVADLVMIDPIGTGFSRVVKEGDSEDHWGVDEDAKSVARFIRAWLTKHQRWASPKYILGESYGGIRGPLLVRELQRGFNAVALNGLILISPALDMEMVDGQDNDAAYATVIPTYAATAWYHDALPERPTKLEPFLDEVRAFVREEYVPALFAGRDLPKAKYDAVVAKLHRYTGLSEDYLRRANLKVSTNRFRRELLRDRGLVVGRLDTRYTGTEADEVGEVPSGDPFGSGISGAYVAGFRHYLQSELEVIDLGRPYEVMSGEASSEWNRPDNLDSAFSGYLDVAPALARGMADNPGLRLFVGSGYFDIATSFFAAEHNIARSTIPLDRVTLRNYSAGHMMYVHEPSFEALAKDLADFIRAGQTNQR